MDTTTAATAAGVCTDPREQCDNDWEFWCDLLEAMLYHGKVPAKAKARPSVSHMHPRVSLQAAAERPACCWSTTC